MHLHTFKVIPRMSSNFASIVRKLSSNAKVPVAKQAKIVKLSKIETHKFQDSSSSSDFDTSDFSLSQYDDLTNVSSQIQSRYSTILNSTTTSNTFNKSFESFESTINQSDSDDYDVSGEYLTKLYVIKDHAGTCLYGDLSVRKGEFLYLISESDTYCFVENKDGVQGFVPKEICIDLDETVRKAQNNFTCPNCKITSL